MKETDLAKPIIDHLESLHWDVYQEVPCGSGVADIVAVLDEKMWVVELKKSLSLQLLDQAIYRCVRVHYVSIGIPYRNMNTKHYYAVETILNHFGIGVFMVGASGRLSEERKPRLNEDPLLSYDLEKTFKALHPKMKQNKAGSLPGNNWTPWKEWKKNVEKVVAENPGITPKQMVINLESIVPYSKPENAANAAVRYARNGLIGRVRVAKENNRLRLYPREAIKTRSKGM